MSVLIYLLVVIIIAISIELYYYRKPEFVTKLVISMVAFFGLMYITGFDGYIISQLEADIKTTTYYPVANASNY